MIDVAKEGTNTNDETPRSTQERAEWFANCEVEQSQDLADFHGDATADRRS